MKKVNLLSSNYKIVIGKNAHKKKWTDKDFEWMYNLFRWKKECQKSQQK
ncbi:hypothetical protein HYS50_01250 [Candidatus Woesearchaeota archaeon]|nr:hypothetical protein [Candidatus Woesearchaeota archaeon]